MLLRIGVTGLLMSLLVSWVFHHAPLPVGAGGVVAHGVRQTVAFTSIVFFEWLFAFQARSAERGVLQLGLFRNRWLFLCMLIGLALQMLVVYLPAANKVFHTRPLMPSEWVWMLLPGIVAVTLETARKRIAPNIFGAGQWKPLPKRGAGSAHLSDSAP
jgi:Ca2+-transporting ATPase